MVGVGGSGLGAPYRGEHLCGLLDGSNLGPAPLLEELHAGWVMQRG